LAREAPLARIAENSMMARAARGESMRVRCVATRKAYRVGELGDECARVTFYRFV